jgi:hypothetical protein
MDQEGVEEARASIRKWMLDFVEEIFYQLAYHIYQPHAFWEKNVYTLCKTACSRSIS